MNASKAYPLYLLAIIAISLAAPLNGQAQVGDFVSFDVPGASFTYAIDVNNSGVVVGRYADANGTHGFVLNQGVFTSIDFPGAVLTVAHGINDLGITALCCRAACSTRSIFRVQSTASATASINCQRFVS
jgi:hypothetical protein